VKQAGTSLPEDNPLVVFKKDLQARLTIPGQRFGHDLYYDLRLPEDWTVLKVNGFDYATFCSSQKKIRDRLMPICWWEYSALDSGRCVSSQDSISYTSGCLHEGPPPSDESSEFGVAENVSCVHVIKLANPAERPPLLTVWQQDPINPSSSRQEKLAKLGLTGQEITQVNPDSNWRWCTGRERFLDDDTSEWTQDVSRFCLLEGPDYEFYLFVSQFDESVKHAIRGGYLRYIHP
jgi:hypothetical protein